jgi:hypothetical protein
MLKRFAIRLLRLFILPAQPPVRPVPEPDRRSFSIPDRVMAIATGAGAALSPKLDPRELVSMKILSTGEVLVKLADGSTFTITTAREITSPIRPGALTAEKFLEMIAAQLPINARGGVELVRSETFIGEKRQVFFREAGRC